MNARHQLEELLSNHALPVKTEERDAPKSLAGTSLTPLLYDTGCPYLRNIPLPQKSLLVRVIRNRQLHHTDRPYPPNKPLIRRSFLGWNKIPPSYYIGRLYGLYPPNMPLLRQSLLSRAIRSHLLHQTDCRYPHPQNMLLLSRTVMIPPLHHTGS